MPSIETVTDIGYTVASSRAPDPSKPGETVVNGRVLIFIDQNAGKQWQFPLDNFAADDIAGQLRGEAPKKRIELAHGIPSALNGAGG